MSLSVVVITKDEERNIAACLESVQWCPDLIVVDSESTDRTVEIATRYTPRVFVHPWAGYGPQKNYGMAQSASEWILILDADERVTEPLREEIHRVLQSAPSSEVVGYEIPRRNYFYGRWIQWSGMYPDYQLRLFRRTAARYDEVLLHERLQIAGRIERLSSPLEHDSMPTIRHHARKMMRYTTLGAQEKLKSSDRVSAWQIGTHHLGTILKTYVLRKGYRDGIHGVLVAMFAGMHTFVKYAKAWELLEREGGKGIRG
jgi:glycosyltransferase involved in cell wall biosynthesis